jgi:hypothetical protein
MCCHGCKVCNIKIIMMGMGKKKNAMDCIHAMGI